MSQVVKKFILLFEPFYLTLGVAILLCHLCFPIKIIYAFRTVKYADDVVLLAKEEGMLQGMIHRLIEIGRCYGMERNVEKTKMTRISRQPYPIQIMIDHK